MWMPGKISAHATAKRVIASAERLIEVRHFWRKRKRIAEIRVPAWPMPTQKTKLVMSKAQPTGLLRPQMPIPSQNSQAMLTPSRPSIEREMRKQIHQPRVAGRSIGRATASVMAWNVWAPRINGAR